MDRYSTERNAPEVVSSVPGSVRQGLNLGSSRINVSAIMCKTCVHPRIAESMLNCPHTREV